MCLSVHNDGEKREARASEVGWRAADTVFILPDEWSPIESGQCQVVILPTSVTLTAALAHKPFFASLKSFYPSSETKYIDICTVGQYGEAQDQPELLCCSRALLFF
jgi:hypothetical protein